MKLISRNESGLHFELSEVEDVFLRLVLSAYPIHKDGWPRGGPIPGGGHTAPDAALLEDALRDTKQAHRVRLEAFLSGQPVAEAGSKRRDLRIGADDVEWVLQVMNEVRIGSWYALGCPTEGEERRLADNTEQTPHLIRFDFAGWFLTVLLDALESR